MGLREGYADYACALFCQEADFVAWVLEQPRSASHLASAGRKANGRRDGIHSLLVGSTQLSPAQARTLYHSLRQEVAAHYNGGSYQFLPKPVPMFEQVPPLRNSSVPQGGSGFRWYR